MTEFVAFVLKQVELVLGYCGDFKEIAIFDEIIKFIEQM